MQECKDDFTRMQTAWDEMLASKLGRHPFVWMEYLQWRCTMSDTFHFENVFREHARAMQVRLSFFHDQSQLAILLNYWKVMISQSCRRCLHVCLHGLLILLRLGRWLPVENYIQEPLFFHHFCTHDSTLPGLLLGLRPSWGMPYTTIAVWAHSVHRCAAQTRISFVKTNMKERILEAVRTFNCVSKHIFLCCLA